MQTVHVCDLYGWKRHAEIEKIADDAERAAALEEFYHGREIYLGIARRAGRSIRKIEKR